ncbi:hypothetical protein CLAIMM_05111 [Cladophialophora immunda]|nr:hypothetical protein CLAIMM_05111 [Cladophialophora immunda]
MYQQWHQKRLAYGVTLSGNIEESASILPTVENAKAEEPSPNNVIADRKSARSGMTAPTLATTFQMNDSKKAVLLDNRGTHDETCSEHYRLSPTTLCFGQGDTFRMPILLSPVLETWDDWVEHHRWIHSTEWWDHLVSTHMSNLSLRDVDRMVKGGGGPSQEPFKNCPFCDFEPRSAGPAHASGTVEPTRAEQSRLQSHIFGHLLSIFMLALPGREDIGDSILEEEQSSLPRSSVAADGRSHISVRSHLSDFKTSEQSSQASEKPQPTWAAQFPLALDALDEAPPTTVKGVLASGYGSISNLTELEDDPQANLAPESEQEDKHKNNPDAFQPRIATPDQPTAPRAHHIPDDQWAKKDQFDVQMSKVWELRVQSRGSAAQNLYNGPKNDADTAIYDSFGEVDWDDASLAPYKEPLRTYEQESSRASVQSLHPLKRHHSREAFALGVVFTIIDEVDLNDGRYKCNVWLVVSAEEDHFFCVRIKTYGRRGIVHLAGGSRQCDIDAHAVVHVRGEKPFVSEDESTMRKAPLAVVLDPEIDNGTLSPWSRACFVANTRMAYDIEAAIIGRLDCFSVALLEIYGNELNGGSNSQA